MDRRSFVTLAAGMAALPGAARAAAPVPAAREDAEAVMACVEQLYQAFSNGDIQRYRGFLTDDYLLLENGEIHDLEDDIAFIMERTEGFRRTDSFAFREIVVSGDMAYAVYHLSAMASDRRNAPRQLRWLESMLLRKVDGQWRCALIHSTVIAPPDPVAPDTDKA